MKVIKPFYEINEIVGAYKPYKLIDNGKIHTNSVFYTTEDNKSVKEIHSFNFNDFSNVLYSVVNY